MLLAAGVLLGLSMAVLGLVRKGEWPRPPLSPDAVAAIDGREIPLGRYHALMSDLAADSREPLDDSDRAFALQRLIDEELLILQGIELGLDHSDPSVRKAIARALIGSLASEAESMAVEEAQLREFFVDNRAYFAQPPRPVVHWYRGAAAEYAANDLENLTRVGADENNIAVLQAAGFERVEILPAQPLTPSKASDYLGPVLARLALSLEAGEWSRPVVIEDAAHVLHVVAVEPGQEPPFEAVRDLVETEYRRRQGEAALRRYLDSLRAGRDIRVQPGIADEP